MSDLAEQLEKEYKDLQALAEVRSEELSQAENLARDAFDRLIMAPSSDRQKAMDSYTVQNSHIASLRLELNELNRRRDIAYLAQFEFEESEALEIVQAMAAKVKDARKRLEIAYTNVRIWQNGGMPGITRGEVIRLYTIRDKIQVENQFLVYDTEQAKYRLEHIRAEIASIRAELGLNSG